MAEFIQRISTPVALKIVIAVACRQGANMEVVEENEREERQRETESVRESARERKRESVKE